MREQRLSPPDDPPTIMHEDNSLCEDCREAIKTCCGENYERLEAEYISAVRTLGEQEDAAYVAALRSEPRPQEEEIEVARREGFERAIRWCRNLPTEDELPEFRKALERPDVQEAIKRAREADAASEPRPQPTELTTALNEYADALAAAERWRLEGKHDYAAEHLRRVERTAAARAEAERLFARSQGIPNSQSSTSQSRISSSGEAGIGQERTYTRDEVLRIATAAATMHHGYPGKGWLAADAALMAIEAERSPKEEG